VVGLDAGGGVFNPQLVPAVFGLLDRLGAGWDFLPVTQARNALGAHATGAQSSALAPDALEILRRAADGQIETLLLHRCDALVHHPRRALIELAIERTPNVIAVDVFPSWITEKASLVIPGAYFFETEGSLLSADGSLQALTPGNQPRGDAQEDWRIVLSLAEKVGFQHTSSRARDVFADWLKAAAPDEHFSLEDLRLEGPGAESPQRSASVFRKRSRPSWKYQPRNRAAGSAPSIPRASASEGLRLLWSSSIQGADHLASRSSDFARLRPESIIELNAADAGELKLAEGDLAGGDCFANPARVRINAALPKGLAYGAANALALRIDDEAALPKVKLKKLEPGR
jgi:anaerobic selenocysteine-containing dehydrogenase